MKIEQVGGKHVVNPGPPTWHPQENTLYIPDADNGNIIRFDPQAGTEEVCVSEPGTGSLAVQEDGALLLFQTGGVIKRLKEKQLQVLSGGLPGEEVNLFGPVVVDPRGDVLGGTIGVGGKKGTVYRLGADGLITPFVREIIASAGIGLSPDANRLYFSDAGNNVIHTFDYNPEISVMFNIQDWVTIEDANQNGTPSGLAVDEKGNIWSARNGGSCVVRYDAEGVEIEKIEIPISQVSGVCFGGKELQDLYFVGAQGAGSGGIFSLEAGVKGAPIHLSKLKGDSTHFGASVGSGT